MDKTVLERYRANKKRIKRLRERIEDEKLRDIPVVAGKVKGSSPGFPYTEQRFSVQMDEPVEAEESRRRIQRWGKEIEKVHQEIIKAEDFIDVIQEPDDQEIFSLYFLEGDKRPKQKEIADKMHCERSTISKKINKYI